jgi:heme exporter protein C
VSKPASIKFVAWLWFAATVAILVAGFRQAIFIAPTEATMGFVQRIFYYHVPNAVSGLIFPYVNLAGSLAFLYWRRRDPLKALAADALALAAAEVTLVFVSIGLVTGMLWAKPAWGIWWTWDERLTTYLLLWLIYVSYFMVRRLSSTGQTQTLAAVLSVFAGIDVPIVYMSIRWWRTQHPSPVFFGGADTGIDHAMKPAFFLNLAGWFMWGVLVTGLRYALERRRQSIEQDNALRAIEANMEIPQ